MIGIRRFRHRALIEARLRAPAQQTLTAALEEMVAAGEVTFARPRAKPGPKSQREEVMAWIGDRAVTQPRAPDRSSFRDRCRKLDKWRTE